MVIWFAFIVVKRLILACFYLMKCCKSATLFWKITFILSIIDFAVAIYLVIDFKSMSKDEDYVPP